MMDPNDPGQLLKQYAAPGPAPPRYGLQAKPPAPAQVGVMNPDQQSALGPKPVTPRLDQPGLSPTVFTPSVPERKPFDPPGMNAPVHNEQSPGVGLRSIAATAPPPSKAPVSATSAPIGVAPVAPVSPVAPATPAPQLAPWALKGIQGQGANPADFAMAGNQLISNKPVDQNSTAEYDRAVAANPQVHGIGVQAPAAQPAGRPGISVYRGGEQTRYQMESPQGGQAQGQGGSGDPVRDSMMEMLNYYRTQGGEVGAMQNGQLSAINALSQYDQSQARIGESRGQAGLYGAQAKSLDPNASLDTLRQITDDPNLRATYLASKGYDPNQIGVLPSPRRPGDRPVDGGNIHDFLGRRENVGAATILGDKEASLYDTLAKYQSLPGAGTPGHPNHDALQTHVNQRYASPRAWDEETYVPPNPEESGIPAPLRGIAGTVAALTHGLTGSGHSAGTGPGWAKFYEDRQAQQDLLQRLGIIAPGVR